MSSESPSAPAPPEFVFKIFRKDEWNAFEASGSFSGSKDDERDGFIHLSNEEQLQGTLDKHYVSAGEVVIAKVRSQGLRIVMEKSRGDMYFPHLFADLPMSSIESFESRTVV